MKKTILLLLLVTGFAFAQPAINNPDPYQVCDDNADGIAAFDLNLITPTLITVQGTEISYYLTLIDSQTASNPINLLVPFTNSTAFNQTIYIRAIDVADPSVAAFTTLNVVVSQKPTVSMNYPQSCFGTSTLVTTTANSVGSYSYSYFVPQGLTNPGNVASFSTTLEGYYYATITDNVTGCVSNQAGVYVFFTPLPGATVGATSICDGNPSTVVATYSANNPTLTWTVPVGATNPGNVNVFSTSVAGDYSVVVTDNNSGCVSNQASAMVVNATTLVPTFSTITPSVCSGFLLPTTSDNGISGTWSPAVQNTGTYTFTPNLGQCGSTYSTFITVQSGINASLAPVLVQTSVTNNAIFNLTNQTIFINSDSNTQFRYFPSYTEAVTNTNEILDPTAYTNVTNPQTVGVRVFNLVSNDCDAITYFTIEVNNTNNVYIPDANFKARLISIGVDTNFDGDIQFTEATAFTNEINVSAAQITNLTGIEAFTNITVLRCSQNNLTGLNINNLTNLETLDCSNNQIATLNISNLINLKNLICATNLLTSLDVSSLTVLEELNFYNNQLTTINVAELLNLKKLNCSYNGITALSVTNLPNLERLEYVGNYSISFTISNLPNLKYLDCSYNYYIITISLNQFPLLEYINCSGDGLTTLNISNLNNLITLYADSNGLTTINLNNLPNLSTLYVSNNQLANLNVSGFNNLNNLSCGYNQLTSLNLAGLSNLNSLYCSNNQLDIINFAGLNGLSTVYCDNNLLTSLDFSLTPNLSILSCSYNNLSTINIKNGTNSFNSGVVWSQNPLLNFVCCDDGELAAVNQILNQSQNSNNGNVVFNSYCSFVPGGNYNTITGQIKFDANNNGCDAADLPQPHIKVNINDGLVQGATFTDADGNYTFYTQAGNFNITPEVENTTWYSVTPPSIQIPFGNTNNNTTTQNFCVNPIGNQQDLEIVIEPIDFARPGMEATYKIVYKNKGNTTTSGSFNFNYNEALLNFISATVVPTSQANGILNWNYTNLLPFENRSFYLTFYVNAASATPAVNVGSNLNFAASISPVNSDENQTDNQFNYTETVINTYLPNAVTCIEGELVSASLIGDYLHYALRFENTGNYLAQNVVLRFTIDTAQYDITTLQLLNASHPVYTRITGNVIEFIFDNINLAAAAGSPPVGGHGDVLFKIRTNANLITNDTVLQKAGIYFDYTYPIETNEAETTFTQLSNPISEFDNSVKIYPNPTNAFINISTEFGIESIELYDIQGRILETILETANNTTLDISGKLNGIYFLKIKTEKGSKVEKIIKE